MPVLENRNLLPFVLAGDSPAELDRITGRVARRLASGRLEDLRSVASRLAASVAPDGAVPPAWRRVVLVDPTAGPAAAVGRLTRLTSAHTIEGRVFPDGPPRIVFVAPGFGGLRPGSGAGLYRSEPAFREVVDRAADALVARTGVDLRRALFSEAGSEEAATEELLRPNPGHVTQVVVTCALAALWRSRGVEPDALLGHSVGEYAMAQIAGVLDLESVVEMLVARGRRMETTAPGAMLAVSVAPEAVAALLEDLPRGAELAGRLSPRQSLVSGTPEAVETLAERCGERGVEHRRVAVDRGYHSHLMEPVMEPFAEEIAGLPFRPPRVPYVSVVTGDWITTEEAVSPEHWSRHLRRPVAFRDAVDRILERTEREGPALFLDLGSGSGTLGWIADRLEEEPDEVRARHALVASIAHPAAGEDDRRVLAHATGRLWTLGAPVRWSRVTGPGESDLGLLSEDLEPLPVTWAEEPEEDGTVGALLGLWREVLGGGRAPGAGDDFFAAGGDSLMATRMLFEVEKRFGVEVPLSRFLRSPTAATLASWIEKGRTAAERQCREEPEAPTVEPPDAEPVLSFGQEQLWLTDATSRGSAAYGVPTVLALAGDLDLARLAGAAAALVERHEILRSRYPAVAGRPVMRIDDLASARPAALPVVDVSGAPAPRQEAGRILRQAASRPFDLARGVRRHLLVRIGPRDHRYLLDVHHVAFDGWSRSVILEDLARGYRGETAPGAGASGLRYRDHAAWQRRVFDERRLAPHLAYWRERLAGAPELALPADRRPTLRPSFRGRQVRVPWEPATTAGIKELASREGTSLFTVLLALFQGFLARLAGQDDVVVGSPVAGRERPETAAVVGYFVNMLALRTRIDPDAGMRALLATCRETVLSAYEHREAPFERVVAELAPDRSSGRNPLYQAVLVLQETPPVPELPGLETRRVDFHNGTVKFDLVFQVERLGGRLEAVLEYPTDLFDPTTVERMARHLARFAADAIARPDAPLRRLRLLSQAERHQVAREWNDTARGEPDFVPVHRAALEGCHERPDALAIRSDDATLTFAEVERRVAALARRLRERGVVRGDRVLLWMERSPHLPVAALAALSVGAAYVPVDPAAPDARVRFVLGDCGAALAIADEERAARLLDAGVPVLTEPSSHAATPEPAPPSVTAPVDANDAAYLIYTSGSTGNPKGVEVTHGGLANLAAWHRRVHGIGADDRTTLLANPSFDASVWELWSAWPHGAALCVPPAHAVADPEALGRWLGREGITATFLPTPLADALLALRPGGDTLPPRILIGGDALRHRPSPGSGTVWINHYGPSEDSVVSTWGEVVAAAPAVSARPPSIGRPVDNHRVRVVDPDLGSVSIGVAGELVIAGTGLARGYPGLPAMTAERFVPDPGAGPDGVTPGGRIYRTGDRVRLRPDGRIDFVGRLDRQVKIRGFRIELDEVEAALAAVPGVAEAAVQRVDGTAGGDGARLVGYYTVVSAEIGPGPGSAPEEGSIRGLLRERLPAYMLPGRIVRLDEMPRTASGKIARSALPELGPGAEDGASGGRPPDGPVETALAELWLELLECVPVSAESDFFELGGHSLLASRLASRIAARFAVEVALPFVLERPRLADQAAGLAEMSSQMASSAPPATAIPARADRSTAPLSFAQEQVWVVERLRTASSLYNVPRAFRLAGLFGADSADRLRRALNAVVARHEALRSHVRWGPAGPEAVFPPDRVPEWTEDDLSAVPPEAREGEARRRLDDFAARPFDLEEGPLLRALLLRLADDDHRLALVFHHLVCDGRSLEVVLDELGRLFAGDGDPELAGLEPVTPSFGDFAAWQRTRTGSGESREVLAWWRDRLTGPSGELPEPSLPYDRTVGAAGPPVGGEGSDRGSEGGLVDRTITGPRADALRALARSRRASLFPAVAALFAAFLARVGESDDLLFATASAQRDAPGTERLVGHLVNLFALRLRADGGLSFGELIDRSRGELLKTLRHAEVPLSRVVEAVGGEARGGSNALTRQVLIFQPEASGTLVLEGLEVSAVETARRTAKFDLSLEVLLARDGVREGADGVLCRWEYAAGLFDRTTVLRLADRFDRLLDEVLEAPDAPLARHVALSAAERHQVTVEWAGNGSPAGGGGDLAGRLAERFADGPDRIAVDGPEGALSYAALEHRSGRLAARLAAAGVRPCAPVALLAERSVETVVAICGILRAGAAYVPLDPAYPDERQRWMLEDADARVLVTRAGDDVSGFGDGRTVVTLEDGPHRERSEPPGVRGGPRRAESPAYVMYTSGSTGRPKGVQVPDRAILRLVDGRSHGTLHRDTATFLFAPLAFDASTLELWGALARGGRVVVAPPGPLALDDLARDVERRRVTCLWITAALFHRLGEGELARMRGVESLLSGGDTLLRERVLAALEALPHTVVVDGYGPTENTTFTTAHRMTRPSDTGPPDRPVPIGRPIEGSTVSLLDRHLRPAPGGVPAELCAGGPGLAHGYRGRPGLTADRFVPDPGAGRGGAPGGGRLYRTGDRARWRPGGLLEFLGRRDGQVKVRGHRVELGEVEAALTSIDGVAEAAAVVRSEDRDRDREMVGFWVAEAGAAGPDEGSIREILRRRLPDPLVPSRLVRLDALPVNANGKVERRALRDRADALVGDAAGPAGDGSGEETPETPLERVVAGLWADVLAVESVGLGTDFFRSGGHSLGAIDLTERVRQALDVPAPIALVFDHPVLADYVHQLAEAAGGREVLEEAAEMVERVMGLSEDDIDELLSRSAEPEPVPDPMGSGRVETR